MFTSVICSVMDRSRPLLFWDVEKCQPLGWISPSDIHHRGHQSTACSAPLSGTNASCAFSYFCSEHLGHFLRMWQITHWGTTNWSKSSSHLSSKSENTSFINQTQLICARNDYLERSSTTEALCLVLHLPVCDSCL